ncbi:hypothetical protein [Mesonia sp.]|uniref:hypothetical protein n=1 Tax=Mesonia sp. TaxID=1960830 RepID=UPI003F94BB40
MKEYLFKYGFLFGALPVSFLTELCFYFFYETNFSLKRFLFLLAFNSIFWIGISYVQWRKKQHKNEE